ncbi:MULTISPECIES: N-acetylglucosamine kinase [unclassified Paenibacillus]|uniref:N-acetylglucosamine kinase n=1 Tax=unclassified Paenibacillus TaxID=185978 RepID=UPI000708F6DA|nr:MULTISPECIES: BadF/BadG/BcrA/BcrD ATPase family protein [unclassified Paenibacillus]KQX65860.1 N-acetylglucosamine kinase [Paenibacillus sp. Root444D2]KRE43171.1 N-acetylglucosamine kinase [Paenibacillus sp. Soil724D2]
MSAKKIPFLAVDGGGTKSLCYFFDEHGQIRGQGRSGSCNYQGVGKEAAVRELIHAIRNALEDGKLVGNGEVGETELETDCAALGIAGLDTEYDRRIILALVEEALQHLRIYAKRLIIENDGFAALLGATNGQPGILMIAGTGSIVYGVNDQGVVARAGGWGHRVGDEGSGYWIGKQAIIHILKTWDGRTAPNKLADHILPYLDLKNPEDLFNWTYNSNYSVEKVAELSSLVSQAHTQGDQVAKSIMIQAAEQLFTCAKAVIERINLYRQPFQIILQGGVLQNNAFVREYITSQFNTFAPSGQIENKNKEPIFGMMALALDHYQKFHDG